MIGINGYSGTNVYKRYDDLYNISNDFGTTIYLMENLQEVAPFGYYIIVDCILVAAVGVTYRFFYLDE